jgi:hypothetical protein
MDVRRSRDDPDLQMFVEPPRDPGLPWVQRSRDGGLVRCNSERRTAWADEVDRAARVSCRVPAAGGRPAGHGTVAGGRRARPGVSEQAISGWRRQERIDRRLEPGLSTLERAELAAAKRRIRELEAEVAVHRRAAELLKENGDPKADSRPWG